MRSKYFSSWISFGVDDNIILEIVVEPWIMVVLLFSLCLVYMFSTVEAMRFSCELWTLVKIKQFISGYCMGNKELWGSSWKLQLTSLSLHLGRFTCVMGKAWETEMLCHNNKNNQNGLIQTKHLLPDSMEVLMWLVFQPKISSQNNFILHLTSPHQSYSQDSSKTYLWHQF